MKNSSYEPRYSAPSMEAVLKRYSGQIDGIHEACSSVPPISPKDLDLMVDCIKQDGLQHPILINVKRQLIDGRCRLLACAVLKKDLLERDVVTSDANPWAIARSNIARRHLTDGQKAMLALDELAKERAKAAERKRAGGEKGRNSGRNSLGKDSTPSGKLPQKRAKRAIEITAEATGVSPEKLTMAENVAKADPKLRALVANGTMSLPEAAAACNLSKPKRERVSRKSAVAERTLKPTATSDSHGPAPVWHDEHTVVVDLSDSIRCHRCQHACMLTNTETRGVAYITEVEGEWLWHVLPDGKEGLEETYVAAESAAVAYLREQSDVKPTKKPAARMPKKPR